MSSMVLEEALQKAYAKSNGETIREHTDKLLKRLEKIENVRGKEILKLCPEEWRSEFWNLARIIIEYHDYGKLHSPFQMRLIRNSQLQKPYEILNVPEIPHSFLSPCFLSQDVLEKYHNNEIRVIVQAIAYHHERDIDERIFKLLVNEVAEKDLKRFKDSLFLKFWQYIDPQRYMNPNKKELFRLFVLLKGLLHRVDYTASGDMEVEKESDKIETKIIDGLKKKNKDLNELQNFVKENSDKNLLTIAPTGFGKTEAGALYINKSKGFFILPLRVSIDSIYDRLVHEYAFENVGLMHSTSLFKLIEGYDRRDSDIEDNSISKDDFFKLYKSEKEAKNLSYPFCIATPDQIFPFVFKYGGFERIYSVLGYSKIVIDEIQMYNPRMLAYILKGLQTIHELGGKIMIMTATFPEFLRDELCGLKICFEKRFKPNYDNLPLRHAITVEKDKDILDYDVLEKIVENSKDYKVLVICNTVNKAIETYEKINVDNKYLFHSRFIQCHRKILESKIQKFAPNKKRDNNKAGVWVTTQIAEVSLDIDFDLLYTELSSIDSLIQRMGRINRAARCRPNEPNVFVYCKKKANKKESGCSGIGNIYDKDIFDKTRENLNDCELFEKKKMELVEKIYKYENIKGTNYYKEFSESLKLIDEIWNIGKVYNPIESIRQAQKQFREIFTITIIPQKIYSENSNLIDEFKYEISSKNLQKRVKARKQLMDFSVIIPRYYIMNSQVNISHLIDDIYIAPFEYDFDETTKMGKGLIIGKLDESNLCD